MGSRFADAIGCAVILLGGASGLAALAVESDRAALACAASGLAGTWLLVVPFLAGSPR